MTRAVLLAALLFPASLLADDATDPSKTDAPKTDAKLDSKLIPLGQVVGTVTSFNESDGLITVEITQRYLEANPQAQAGYLRDAQQLLVRQQNIMRTRNLVQRQQQLVQLMRDAQNLQSKQANLFRVKEVKSKVDLQLYDEVKVRTLTAPINYDDKGNIKQYTAAELKELRGKDGLPGFTAEKDTLRQGQTVLVVVARKKPDAEMKPKEKDGDKDTAIPATEKIQATVVVIVAEPVR